MRNGNIKLVRGPWNLEFLDEITSFPEQVTHDDQVDALAHAYSVVTGITGKERRKVQILV